MYCSGNSTQRALADGVSECPKDNPTAQEDELEEDELLPFFLQLNVAAGECRFWAAIRPFAVECWPRR